MILNQKKCGKSLNVVCSAILHNLSLNLEKTIPDEAIVAGNNVTKERGNKIVSTEPSFMTAVPSGYENFH